MEELVEIYYRAKEVLSEIDWQHYLLTLVDSLIGFLLSFSSIMISIAVNLYIGAKFVAPLVPRTIVHIGGSLPSSFQLLLEKWQIIIEQKLNQIDHWFLRRKLYRTVRLVTIIYNITRFSIRITIWVCYFIFWFVFIAGFLFIPGVLMGFILNWILFGYVPIGHKPPDPLISLAYSRVVGFYTTLGASPIFAKIWTFLSGALEAWGTYESAQSLKKSLQKWFTKLPK